jgi:hypothetical protein
MKDHLIIFDTTLRDGEQSPGASMTKEEKLRVARQLERMQVDVIEAGFRGSVARRFRRYPVDCTGDQGLDRLLAGPLQRERHSASRRGDYPGRAWPDSYVHRHQSDPHGEEAAHGARSGRRGGSPGRALGA